MRRFEILVTTLIFCGLYAVNAHAESHRPSEDNDTKQQELLVSEQTQTGEQFNPDACFDKIWQIINDEFWDANFNGVDWQDSRRRYRPKALAAKDHESFAGIINEMLGELKTSHTRYLTKWEPDYYTLQAALISASLATYSTSDTSVVEKFRPGVYSSKAKPHRASIGAVTKLIDGCHYVTAVLTSSPAEKAGIVLGDRLVEVNDQPFHPIRSFEHRAGQEVELTVQHGPSESTRRSVKIIPIDKEERRLFEKDSHDRPRFIEHRGHRFAYIRLWWLNGWTMRQVLEFGINAGMQSEGLIIDIRDGFGGGPVCEYIAPFLQYGLGAITESSIGRTRTFTSSPGFDKPVVVLINGGSRSGKELLAYYFKKTGRGVLVGERTAGYVSGGRWKRISKDSMLYYCVQMIVVDGKRLEAVGVEPDIEVPFDVRFATGGDIQLERAKDEMVKLIEAS